MQTSSIQHPLEPLTSQEIGEAVEIVRLKQSVGAEFKFPCVTLHEPEKSAVLALKLGENLSREGFLILLDTSTGYTYEAIVSLTQDEVISWQHIPDVQPNIMTDELAECEVVVKEHPDFRAAIAQRGITDLDLMELGCCLTPLSLVATAWARSITLMLPSPTVVGMSRSLKMLFVCMKKNMASSGSIQTGV